MIFQVFLLYYKMYFNRSCGLWGRTDYFLDKSYPGQKISNWSNNPVEVWKWSQSVSLHIFLSLNVWCITTWTFLFFICCKVLHDVASNCGPYQIFCHRGEVKVHWNDNKNKNSWKICLEILWLSYFLYSSYFSMK